MVQRWSKIPLLFHPTTSLIYTCIIDLYSSDKMITKWKTMVQFLKTKHSRVWLAQKEIRRLNSESDVLNQMFWQVLSFRWRKRQQKLFWQNLVYISFSLSLVLYMCLIFSLSLSLISLSSSPVHIHALPPPTNVVHCVLKAGSFFTVGSHFEKPIPIPSMSQILD